MKKGKESTIRTEKMKTKTLSPEAAGLRRNIQQRIPTVYVGTVAPGVSEDGEDAGVGYRLLQDRMVTLGHAKASEYVDLPVFPGERVVGDAHVQHLLDAMKAGEFNWANVLLASAWLDGKRWKINGQHTSWAVLYMPEDFSASVREQIYEVDSATALRWLYNSFDAGKPRAKSHRVKVALSGTSFVTDLPQTKLARLATAFAFWRYPERRTRNRISPEQLAREIERDYANLFWAVGKFVCDAAKQNTSLIRMPVIAAIFETTSRAAKKSIEFWQPVADGLHLDSSDDARYRLRQLLEAAYNPSNRRSRQQGLRVGRPFTDEELYGVCVVAWNRWRAGDHVRMLKAPHKRVRAK